MAEEVKQEQEIQQEQPKKKRRHKGAIITWSIIGGVVITLGGVMLFFLSNAKKNSPTAKIQGATYVADTSESPIAVYDSVSVVTPGTQKDILDYVKKKSSEDSGAKELQEAIDKYSLAAYLNNFKNTTIEVSKTTLFNYNKVDVTLKSSSGESWYRYSLQSNGSDGLKTYLNGDEKEQASNLYIKTGMYGSLSLYNTSNKALAPAYGAYVYKIGTATYAGTTYSVCFRVQYDLKK